MVYPKLFSYLLVLMNLVTLSGVLHANILFISVFSALFSFIPLRKSISLISKVALIISTFFLLRQIYVPFLDAECFISLLVVLSAIKLSELKTSSDYFNIFIIFILIESGILLLNPTFYFLLLSLSKIFIFLYFILKLREVDVKNLQLSRALVYTLPVIPITFILFFLTPRSDTKFNIIRFPNQNFSGESEKIDFNDLPPISLSTNVVFHAIGNDLKKVPFSSLYWRGNVFWIEKNGAWSSNHFNLMLNRQLDSNNSDALSYEIKSPTTSSKNIYTLSFPSRINLNVSDFEYFDDGTYRAKPFVKLTNLYSVVSYPDSLWDTLSEKMQSKVNRSSKINSPKTLIWLKNIKHGTPSEQLEKLITAYKKLDLKYSLTPLPFQNLDDFLFDTKTGYCSHFAMSFASLVREIGIPSRVVSGYHGGDFNEYADQWTIREKDSHVWVEIYLDRKWLTIDPTSWVYPGLFSVANKTIPDFQLLGFTIKGQNQLAVVYNKIAMFIEGLNVKASALLDDYFLKEINFAKFFQSKKILFLIIPFLLPVFYQILSSRRRQSPEMRKFNKFLKWARSRGVVIEKCDGAASIKLKCLAALPKDGPFIVKKCDEFINFSYII